MRRIAFLLIAALTIHPWSALATGAEAVAPADSAQPEPEALLRQMADYYADLQAVSCRLNLAFRIQAQGMDQSTDTKMTIRLDRPNRFALILDEGPWQMSLMSDGDQMWQYMPTFNRYTVQAAPDDLSDLADGEDGAGLMMMSGGVIPTDGETFYNQLIENVTRSQYVGQEQIGEVACHHCRFEQEELSWDIWIEAGDRPLVHRIVPDLSRQFAEAGEMFKDATIEYTVEFHDWNTAPDFTEADFAFEPPADAQQVESLFEGLANSFQAAEQEGPHPLLGQPAPAFETVDLAGKPIDLSSHVGQDIVMLDFWATWCGPCVRALPEVDAVAKKFADRGVVFYAVNVQEDAETIQDFFETSEFEVPVAMDPDGKINGLYGVNGIPQTVLVGKDGKVQVVHIGFSPELGEQLAQNIEDLLAGKDLAGPALAEAERTRAESAAGEEPAADPGQ